MAGAFSTAIISSRVPRSPRDGGPSRSSESGCPGGRCPEITVKSCATPRWVTGIPARAGTATGLVSPGTTVTGTPAARQSLDLLETPAEDRAVAALEPNHPLPGRHPVDQDPVDLLLRGGPAAGSLRRRSARRRRAAHRAARAGPAGRPPRRRPPSAPCAPRHRDKLGVTRAAADRTTPGDRSRWWRATMVPSRSPSRISSRTAALAPRLAVAQDRDHDTRVPPTAGVQALAGSRCPRVRRTPAPLRDPRSPPRCRGACHAAMTYQAPSRSGPRTRRRCQVISPAVASPSTADAPGPSQRRPRRPRSSLRHPRRATWPPPTIAPGDRPASALRGQRRAPARRVDHRGEGTAPVTTAEGENTPGRNLRRCKGASMTLTAR